MKNSNDPLAFISKVPSGWGIYRLKEVAKVNLSNVDKKSYDNEKEVKLCNYVDVYYNHTITDEIDYMVATASDEQIKKLTLLKDDVILTKDSESPVDIGIPTWVSNDFPGLVCGYHLALIRPNRERISGLYLYYLLNSFGFKENLWVSAKGVTRFGISKGDIQNFPLMLPPLKEQNSIAKYLKQKDLRIDLLIEKKEQLIKLLEQQRQSIITEAVTKGLNPNVKMKDSGVEWIGEIPAHWKVVKIKHLTVSNKGAIKTGPFGSQLTNNDMNGKDIKIYNQRSVLDNDFVKGQYYISSEKYNELRAFEVYPGDILITTRGTIGKAAIVPDDIECGVLHPCLIRMQLTPNLIDFKLIKTIFNETNFIKQQIELLSNATTIEVIYSETLKNLSIVLPPKEEQEQLMIYIENILNHYNKLLSAVRLQIKKLKEYRQALIYEAVTGKIDVRDMELD